MLSPRMNEFIIRYGLMAPSWSSRRLVRWSIDPWVRDRLSLFTAYRGRCGRDIPAGGPPRLVALVLAYVSTATSSSCRTGG